MYNAVENCYDSYIPVDACIVNHVQHVTNVYHYIAYKSYNNVLIIIDNYII